MKTKSNIMKTVITLLFNSLAVAAFSQDTITMRNGNELIAKVIEISATEIKYKKMENQDGPTYIENKSEVVKVTYKNGIKDIFKFEKPWLVPSNEIVEATPVIKKYPKLLRSGNIYFSGDKMRTEGEMQRDLLLLNNRDLNYHVHKAREARGLQNVGFAAIPLAFVGALFYLSSTGMYYNYNNNKDNIGKGTTLFGLAAISLGTSIYFKVKRTQHNAAAVKLYNETY